MMKKMLMVASVASMIDQFNRNNILLLQEEGYEVHVAANFENGSTFSQKRLNEFKNELTDMGITYHQINFSRSILNINQNYKAYRQLRKLLFIHKFEFIHCHSPIGGVCGRIAAHKTGVKVIYTAHGFHFFQGASLMNWLLFYPVERLLASITDILITLNKEDYFRAREFKAKQVAYIPSIGINIQRFKELDISRAEKRKQLEIEEDAFVLLSVGELSKRKNHETILEAISALNIPKLTYIICGQGKLGTYLEEKAEKLGVKVIFLGYRKDINEIYVAADLFLFPSLQEGLPVALMEAMASGLPVICSRIRGNNDLIEDNLGGYLVQPKDVEGYRKAIQRLFSDKEMRSKMGKYNQEVILDFEEVKVNAIMKGLYENITAT